jgi:trk system potassium uptake protein TrkH
VVEAPSFWGRLLEHPARALVVTFFLLVVVGTLLLSLPQSAASGNPVSFVDAAFTSASAVCVTGLIVLDTPNAFSTSGLFFLILLIQVGGLGIMTFYTVALRALGRRVSVRHERVLAGALAAESRQLLYSSVRRVLLVTLVSEAAGAAILFLSFAARGEPLGTALGRAAFTAVSAFCNAGFALQSDSLIPYANDPIVLHVVGALIVLGGLSPVAVVALPRWSKRRRLPLQISIGVVTSALLLVSGALLYALIEWEASLGGLTTLDRLHNAWFQSVTLRTAGFNSVDLVETRPATQTLMLLFMLVGGSPGGTAGGIKTTTFAVLLMTVAATLRGLPETTMFGRRVGKVTVLRATAVATVGMVVALVALVAMELTQEIPLDVAVFEVVSALGTVGLSIGGTAMLDEVGKVIIMACMFAGRVGPLTLFLFLADERAAPPVEYPHEEVEVG